MSLPIQLKSGDVYKYNVCQNSANYIVRIANVKNGLWMLIQQSHIQWKLTLTQQLILNTTSKVMNGQSISYNNFSSIIFSTLKKQNQLYSIGIMTAIQLQILRGGNGNSNKNHSNNKLYMIITDKSKKIHFPFTFILNETNQKDKLIQAIKKMKQQLDQLRGTNDKSQSSFSIMSQSVIQVQQIKIQNQQLKKKIHQYQQSLVQKRGAVQIDNILRQMNTLQLQGQTKKREQNKQITKLKGLGGIIQRQNTELINQIQLIQKQLMLLQDNIGNAAKLKSHALRVLKSYDTQLRTSKKIFQKQIKQIQNNKRNLLNSKANQRKQLGKIKLIQQQIEQAKKKANIKQISNRLYSPNNSKGGSISGKSLNSSQKAPSLNSDDTGSRRSVNKVSSNMVRQNLLKRTSQLKANNINRNQRSMSNTGGLRQRNSLLKTTPNINTHIITRKQYKPPVRPVLSSHGVQKQSPANRTNKSNNWSRGSNKSSSVGSSVQKKPQLTLEQKQKIKQRQKQMIQRLSGNKKKEVQLNNQPKVPLPKNGITNQSNRNSFTATNNKSRQKKINNKSQKQTSKQLMNRLNAVKATYNNRAKQSFVKNKNVAQKIAKLATQQK